MQDALNLLTGPTVGLYEPGLDKIVTIPLYDCVDNNIPQCSPASPARHPQVSVGTNTSYRIVALGAMILDKAYIQANNPECNQTPGSPSVGRQRLDWMLKGWLTQISGPGEVPPPPDAVLGIRVPGAAHQVAPRPRSLKRRAGRRGASIWADHRVPPATPFGLCIRAPIQGSV